MPLHLTPGSARARVPQYVSPDSSFFLVDLQGNGDPRFANAFLVDPAHCISGSQPNLACTFTVAIPGGDATTQRWSIAAGAGKTDGTSGPPLSVIHDVIPFVSPTGTVTVHATLDTIVASVGNAFLGYQDFSPLQPSTSNPTPYFLFTADDAFGNAVQGDTVAELGLEQFANPIVLAEDDASGELHMDVIDRAIGGPIVYGAPAGPVSTVTFARLTTLAAIRIDDGATAARTMNVTYSVPEVDLVPSEFSQLTAVWRSPARTGTLLTVVCVPKASVAATANPCTQVSP